MWNEEHDGENEMFVYGQKNHKETMTTINERFRAAAHRGYDLLTIRGMDAIDFEQREDAILAIRRILGLMIIEEEYEKCQFIKNFLVVDLQVSDPKPIFDFEKNINS